MFDTCIQDSERMAASRKAAKALEESKKARKKLDYLNKKKEMEGNPCARSYFL